MIRTLRRFTGDTLLIASHNPGKVREIGDLLSAYVARFPSAAEYGLDDPEETGTTFEANAELKALAAARAVGLPALADDSGLAVAALEGRPGIHSARYAERPDGRRDFAWAMDKLRREVEALGDGADRTAAFMAALTLAWPDGHTETVLGRCGGTLAWPPRGGRGFGYDPIFVPAGHGITFGEMEPAAKHGMSHRADAFRQLVARCFA